MLPTYVVVKSIKPTFKKLSEFAEFASPTTRQAVAAQLETGLTWKCVFPQQKANLIK